MAWINFTDFTGNSATFPGDYLVGYIGVQEQRYPVVALKNGLSAGLFTAQNLLVTEDTTIRGNLSVLGSQSVFETIVSVTSALSVVNTGTGPALTVKQTGVQPIALFLDDNNNTFRIDDDFKVSFFNSHATGQYSVAEGDNTVASGQSSHAEGGGTDASGNYSHAQGLNTDASGNYSNAQGHATTASGEASHAEGYITIASGQYSHAEGNNTMALGNDSHAEGANTTASSYYSHAEGYGSATGRRNAFATYTAATKIFTFAPAVSANFAYVTAGTLLRGREDVVLSDYFTITVASRNIFTGAISAVAAPFGSNSTTGYLIDNSGDYSHAEGEDSTASGGASHAEGYGTTASGQSSHAEGNSTLASGDYSHAEGSGTYAIGADSHAEGSGTHADEAHSHAEGLDTVASGIASHAEGFETTASGLDSHAEGSGTRASGDYSHAEGNNTTASGLYSHAQGTSTVATGQGSHAQGAFTATGRRNAFATYTAATKTFTFASTISANFAYVTPGITLRGYDNNILGDYFNIVVASRSNITGVIVATADVIGSNATVGYLIDNSGTYSHAQGIDTTALGLYSHAEGNSTTASGTASHAEGGGNVASGVFSHAEGEGTAASGPSSHAEGNLTTASGQGSHAEGGGNVASGQSSHAEGEGTAASGQASHAAGSYAAAANDRSWIWKGSTNTVVLSTTRTDQFVVSAAGGLFLNNAVGINTDSIANALTVNGNISGTSGLTVDALTGRNISLVHTPANDGTNAFIQLGEFTTGSTTASAFSGYRLEYNENTNAFNLSSILGAATTDVININNSGNVTANSVTARGALSANGNVTGNQADFTNTTIRGTLSASTGVFGNTSIFGSLSVLSPNYNSLITRGVSALAADPIPSIINSRVGIETVPLTSYSLHIRGGNLRVDGVDYSNVPNITSFDTDGQSLFDLRSAFVGSNYSLSIAESGLGNFMKFFGGRTGDAQPFIVTKAGSPLRFATFNNYYDGASFSEKVRIGGNGNLSVGLVADGNEKVTVLGNISASGSLIGNSLTSRNISIVHAPANDGTNPFIQLGEFTTGSTTASAFSGFRLEYNENTNAFNLSSIFGATTTDVININSSGNITTNSVTVRGTLSANGNVTVVGTISGQNTNVALNASRAPGLYSLACGSGVASGDYSHAQGANTTASGDYSHAEGSGAATGRRNAFVTYTAATKTFTFAPTVSANFAGVAADTILRGYENDTLGGYFTITVASRSSITGSIVATADAIGSNSSNGYLIDSSGDYSHAQGANTTASGIISHAEGNNTVASGQSSHAEGHYTVASGFYSHAEGNVTVASGNASHAEGEGTAASGSASHAAGGYAKAAHDRSWIWKGSTNTVVLSTTRTDQFMVSAANGLFLNNAVGINTDSIQNALTVMGTVSASTAVIAGAFVPGTNFINTQSGTTYLLTNGDNGRAITLNNASPITVAIPSGLPVGYNVILLQLGSGQVSLSAGVGVSIASDGGKTKIASQHSTASLLSYASNIFNFSGNITS